MKPEIKIVDVWGKSRQDRKGVVIEIENRGVTFKWMPSYKELSEIYMKLAEVEIMNVRNCTKDVNLCVELLPSVSTGTLQEVSK